MIDLSLYEDIDLSHVDPAFVMMCAREFIGMAVESVTDKVEVAPSGDPQDYYSWAPYVWVVDGRMVRRDGKVNPEVSRFDKSKLVNFSNAVKFLGEAFKLTGEASFASKSQEWLRAWMVDPVTRMNPHFRYAQAAPFRGGLGEGGIIEGRRFIWTSRVVRELVSKGKLFEVEASLIKEWFGKLLDWLLTSPQGKMERQAPNNHGTWYDALVLSLAIHLGRDDVRDEVLSTFLDRIRRQMGVGGSFPLEERREDPVHYVRFNLNAMLVVMEAGLTGIQDGFCQYPSPQSLGVMTNPRTW